MFLLSLLPALFLSQSAGTPPKTTPLYDQNKFDGTPAHHLCVRPEPNATLRDCQEKFNDAISAQDFALQGICNSSSIQAAITAAGPASNAGKVIIPPNCTGTYSNPNNIWIEDQRSGQSAGFTPYLAPFTGSVLRSQQSKNADVLHAKDFGVVADGVTNDRAALQAAINASITLNRTLILPESSSSFNSGSTGCINIGTASFPCGATSAAICLNIGTQIVNMQGTVDTNVGTNSCIIYGGTGRAMAISNTTINCVPGVSGFIYNGSLKDFRMAMSNGVSTAVGLTTCNLNQSIVQGVNFDAIPATNGNVGAAMSLQGATFINQFNNIVCQGNGTSQLSGGAFAAGVGNWTDCVFFDETAGSGAGQVEFRGFNCFGVNNCFHLDSGTPINFLFADNSSECVNNFMLVSNNVGAIQADSIILRGNRPSQGCVNADNTFLKIQDTLANRVVLRDWQIYDNVGNCPNSVVNNAYCSGVHNTTGAHLSRTGSTVTATVTEANSLFWNGMRVYKAWLSGGAVACAGSVCDANFPGGMKTVTGLIPSNCNPLTGSPVCTGFTYTEAVACSGAGVCAAGCSGPCLASSPSTFTSATAPIKHESANASTKNGSAVDLNIFHNQFQGWSNGLFQSYSNDVQSTPCTQAGVDCNIMMVRMDDNTDFCNFGGGLGFCVRNNFTVNAGSGYAPQTEAATWTPPAPELTAAAFSTTIPSIAEVHISDTPTNQYALSHQSPPAPGFAGTTAASIISLTHKKITKVITLAAGASVFYVPDVYSICNCRDITTVANSCTSAAPLNPLFVASQFPVGSVALTGTGTDTVVVECK